MKKFLTYMLVFSFCFVGAVSAQDISSSKKKLVRELMEANGTMDHIDNSINQAILTADDSVRWKLEVMLNQEEIVELLIPVYHEYYTSSDLRSLTEFYKSEVGRKMLKVTPMLMKKSINVMLQHMTEQAKKVQ